MFFFYLKLVKKYVGCFDAIATATIFNGSSMMSHQMTNKFCMSFCYSEGYKYAATQNKYFTTLVFYNE